MGSVVDILDGQGRKSRVTAEPRTESVSELIMRCNAAIEKMGNGNPNKQLVFDCARTLKELCDRLFDLEGPGEEVILGSVPVGESRITSLTKVVGVPDGE